MGVLDAPALSQVAGDGRYPRRGRHLTAGLPQIADRSNPFCYNSLSNGTDTSGNYRYGHLLLVDAHDFRLLFTNYTNGRDDAPNAITVKCSVEPPANATTNSTSATAVYPVTFNGALTVTISPSGFALSDPIPLQALSGQYVYTRTYVSVASAGMKWPLGTYIGSLAASRQEGFVTGAPATDRTAAGTTISGGFGPAYGPALFVGVPAKGAAEPKTVFACDDSIGAGSGDSYHDMGFIGYACATAGAPLLNAGLPGELSSDFQQGTGKQRQRMNFAGARPLVLEGYGRNDIGASVSLASLQSTTIAIWTNLAARRGSVYRRTMIPNTTTTDNWFTVGNQTATANDAVRVSFNTWLRDGAPIHLSGGVWVADTTGTVGASIARCNVYDSTGSLVTPASGPTHLLAGVLEAADLVESARNSSKWKAPERTVTDAAITSAANVLTSATAAFTSADVGKSVAVVGAGSAGARLDSVITAYTNATTVTILANAGTTVSGASAAIGVMTSDGTHPTTSGHKAIAPAYPIANLN